MPEHEQSEEAAPATGGLGVAGIARAAWRARLWVLAAAAGSALWTSAVVRESAGFDPELFAANGAFGGIEYLFTAADPAEVDAITLRRPGAEAIQLSLSAEGDWQVHDGLGWRPMARHRAETLFDSPSGQRELVRNLPAVVQAADPGATRRLFTGEPTAGMRVEFLADGRVVEEIELGRATTRLGETATFVRRPGSGPVLLVGRNLLDNFAGAGPADWLDRTLTPFEGPSEVASLALRGPDGGYELRRDGDGWIVLDAAGVLLGAADGDRAARAVRSALGVTLRGALGPAAEAVEDPAAWTLELAGAEGAARAVLEFGAALDNGLHAVASSHRPGRFAALAPVAALRSPAEFLAAE